MKTLAHTRTLTATFTAIVITLVIGATGCTKVPLDGPQFNEDGYRFSEINTVTPDFVPGGETVSARQLKQMLDKGEPIGLVDVLPTPPRPPELSPDTLWIPQRHDNIPGSVWLPGVGLAEMSPALETYFRKGLARATKNNTAVPVVIYCREHCWWSWNAAMRTASWGYKVYWFPGGVEEWAAAGYSMVQAHPEPTPP